MVEFSVSAAPDGDGTRIAVTGELDIATAPKLAAELASAYSRGGRLVIDLTATTFLDSSGLKLFGVAGRRLGTDLVLVCPADNHPVMRVIHLAGLDQAVTVVEPEA